MLSKFKTLISAKEFEELEYAFDLNDIEKVLDLLFLNVKYSKSLEIKLKEFAIASSEIMETKDILRKQSMTDLLTGLLNHASFKDRLKKEIERYERYGNPFSLVMFDLDHFKKVNDTHGHLAGDGVLMSISELLKLRLRSTDVISRYGGEEFAIIMLETTLCDAQRILDRVREEFSFMDHDSEKKSFNVTFSAGISEVSKGDTLEGIIIKTDKLLYESKSSGRNKITVGLEC